MNAFDPKEFEYRMLLNLKECIFREFSIHTKQKINSRNARLFFVALIMVFYRLLKPTPFSISISRFFDFQIHLEVEATGTDPDQITDIVIGFEKKILSLLSDDKTDVRIAAELTALMVESVFYDYPDREQFVELGLFMGKQMVIVINTFKARGKK